MDEFYPCIKCQIHVEEDEHAVQCEKCELWQHRTCDTGISERQYLMAVEEEINIAFVCTPCTARIPPIDDAEYSDDDALEAMDTAEGSFRVDVPFEPPVVIHERSLIDPPLPDDVQPDVPVTYEVIEKGSQKGSDLLVDSLGYSYNLKDRRGNCVRWSCSVKNKTMRCLATITQKGGVFKPSKTDHTHAPDASRGITAKVTKKAKEVASRDVFQSAREIVVNARQEERYTGVGHVNDLYVARRINRKRLAMRPEDPKDMDFELDHGSLPDGFLRDDIEVDGRRHLVFASDTQLSVLGRASRWYIDGTFKCMRHPFVMLLTIHAFVRRADCSKQVPLVFALMTGRKLRDYWKVFESIKVMLGDCTVQGIVTDFEKAIWRAVKHVFPGVAMSGCAFHWGQAIWSHVQEEGLATQYMNNKATHAYIRKLLSLPFLPVEHIRPTFESMKEFNSSEKIRRLLRYMQRHWFQSSVWSVEEWCVYGQSVRTNNDVEGWHRRLNVKTGDSPPFYRLVNLLHREAAEVSDQIDLVAELALRRLQRRSARSMQSRLFKAWDLYASGELSTTGLLKKVSVLYAHRTPRQRPESDSE